VEDPILLAVPNVSEGRDRQALAQIASAFADSAPASGTAAVRLLDVHSDADHHRSVFTIAGAPRALGDALLRGARATVESVDVVSRADAAREERGQHPHVGSVDVVPIVYVREADRGAACALALLVADRIGQELDVPVFLYGELTGETDGEARTRAQLRRGGVSGLARRLAAAGGGEPQAAADPGEGPLTPDFGPHELHARAGATLVCARAPLVAFNLQLADPATLVTAREVAALVREGGPMGLPGVRAIGVMLGGARAQVSMNVERPLQVPLAEVLGAVSRLAPVHSAELVGLAPAAAMAGFPADVPMPGFDPQRHVIENALGC